MVLGSRSRENENQNKVDTIEGFYQGSLVEV